MASATEFSGLSGHRSAQASALAPPAQLAQAVRRVPPAALRQDRGRSQVAHPPLGLLPEPVAVEVQVRGVAPLEDAQAQRPALTI